MKLLCIGGLFDGQWKEIGIWPLNHGDLIHIRDEPKPLLSEPTADTPCIETATYKVLSYSCSGRTADYDLAYILHEPRLYPGEVFNKLLHGYKRP